MAESKPPTLTFISKMMARQPKQKSAVPTMKKMTKAVEAMGKHVGAYEIRPDGGVRVLITTTEKATSTEVSTPDTDWWEKKVLKNGQT
jgi:hypothetical protein